MGTHDAYGKKVLDLTTNGQFQHWFIEEERTVEYPSSGIVAKQNPLGFPLLTPSLLFCSLNQDVKHGTEQ